MSGCSINLYNGKLCKFSAIAMIFIKNVNYKLYACIASNEPVYQDELDVDWWDWYNIVPLVEPENTVTITILKLTLENSESLVSPNKKTIEFLWDQYVSLNTRNYIFRNVKLLASLRNRYRHTFLCNIIQLQKRNHGMVSSHNTKPPRVHTYMGPSINPIRR